MSGRTIVAAAAMAVLALAAPTITAAGAPKKWHWSETYAETRVVQKVLVPCPRVRQAKDCNLADALAEMESWQQYLDACVAITEPARSLACLQSMLNLRNPEGNLNHVRRGFPVKRADCVGGGAPDKSGFRFSQFRCKITVQDRAKGNKLVEVSGRIVVYVTGRKTFRWAVI